MTSAIVRLRLAWSIPKEPASAPPQPVPSHRPSTSSEPIVRKGSFITEAVERNEPVYAALLSPRSRFVPKEKLQEHEMFRVIDRTYELFMKQPLAFSHENPTEKKRVTDDFIKMRSRGRMFRNRLRDIHNLGPDKYQNREGVKQLGQTYLQKLYTICKGYLDQYEEVKEDPVPSALLSPRSNAKSRSWTRILFEYQQKTGRKEKFRDSYIRQCVVDISCLTDSYMAELRQIESDFIKAKAEETFIAKMRRLFGGTE
jgi:hypothetical protein